MSALSAVEMALWDIKGKALGVPVYQLLGGKVRDTVPCYANGWFASAKTPDEFAEKAVEAVGQGFNALKWDPFGHSYLQIERKQFNEAMACVEAVHHAVKDKADLIIFELKAADFIQPDVSHAGGIMELKKIAAMAEAYHIPICPHNPSGPVANAATLQLAASIPNFYLLETMNSDVPWRSEISTEEVIFREVRMVIPDKPGLGIDIDTEHIKAHPYHPQELRHYQGSLIDIRPVNATGYFKKNQ